MNSSARPLCFFCEYRAFSLSPRPSKRSRPSSSVFPIARRPYYNWPSFAPKPVLDIKHILKNPGLYEQNCIDRNYANQAKHSWRILELAEERAQGQKSTKGGREEYNRTKSDIEKLQRLHRTENRAAADFNKTKDDELQLRSLQTLLDKAKRYKEDFAKVSAREKHIEDVIQDLAFALPNLSSLHTPNGKEPEVTSTFKSSHPSLDAAKTSHVDIGTNLDLLDFSSAANTSGWGFYFLKNGAALLEQALIQYTLSFLMARGWTILTPPSMVYTHIAAACGFAPRDANDEQQIYNIAQPEKDAAKPGSSLAATAEIPLAGMYAGHTFQEKDLPLKAVAVSRCYRAEAGARGVDTKGLYRVHEFTKVEMFAWTLPDENGGDGEGAAFGTGSDIVRSHSQEVFDEMLEIQQALLKSLDLTYRVLEMPATDLGGPATRKNDIEVYFPSRRDKDKGWGEVTSTSICTDYQSRRLGAKVKRTGKGSSGRLEWPHTVNGTAMALPRIMAALLEYGWDETTRVVKVPEVLHPWMGGMKVLEKK